MPALQICTAADVIRRFGGTAAVTTTIPDGTDPGIYDSALMTTLIGDSSEEIAARGNVQVDVQALKQAIDSGAVTEWPPYLVDIVAWLTVDKIWDGGSQGQAKPDHIRAKAQYILDVECERLRRREISLGAPLQYPGTNQLQTRVDPDPDQNRLMRPAFRARGGFG